MSVSRPFAYNPIPPGSLIPGTIQIGDIAIGVSGGNYSEDYGGVKWWNGPDEALGYVFGVPSPGYNQPTPVGISAGIGFWRSTTKTEPSFIELVNTVFSQSFTNGIDAKTWLNGQGYWTSFGNDFTYSNTINLPWPSNPSGYTLYSGGFTAFDDGYSNSPITIPSFAMNGSSSTSLYINTNGYLSLGSGHTNIFLSPQDGPLIRPLCGNSDDLWLQPGLVNTDGDVQNAWYQVTNQGGGVFSAKFILYQGRYQSTTQPWSYIINIYKDTTYQWMEARVKTNFNPASTIGPYNTSDVSQTPSTVSKVWRGDLNGQNWTYLGTGSIV